MPALSTYQRRKASGLCPSCGKFEPEGSFSLCEVCRQYFRADYTDKRKAYHRKYWKERRAAFRAKAIEVYGGKCTCCGESNPRFLCVDHVEGGGNKHRREINQHFYEWLDKNGYPKEGFRLLCFNCNCAREYNGGLCPHEENIT